jgi:dTDP-4-dehydrorhamnose reductase
MKKIMITGCQGQLGLALTEECLHRGTRPITLSRKELDITRLDSVRECIRFHKPAAVLNCAAFNEVDRAEDDEYSAILINGIGPRNLAISAQENNAVIMHFSSDFVFDGTKRQPYSIDDLPNPISRYGYTKLMGEGEVRSLANRHFVVRLSWVFGPGSGKTNFVSKVFALAKANAKIKMVSDQLSIPSFTGDLAPALIDLLNSRAYGLYHLASTGHCSRYEWTKAIVEACRLDVDVEPIPSASFSSLAKRPTFSALDSFPMEAIIGRKLPEWKDATMRYLKEIGAIK